jgi:hypothetical protein
MFRQKDKKELDSVISDSGLYYLIKFGDDMRAGIDIGSLAVENNSKLCKLYLWTTLNLSFFLAVTENVESEACLN